MSCMYVGDIIAVGLHQLEPKCAVHAQVSASSALIVRKYKGADGSDHAVISMGSNDPGNPLLLSNAENLRRSIHAKTVIWILPYNRTAAQAIEIVAHEFHDRVVDLKPIPTKDGVYLAYENAHKKIQHVLKYAVDR
jgi:hypothetical protein